MQQIKLCIGEYDWMATRLTPRKYYPPKPKIEDPRTADEIINSRPSNPIFIPGVEGMGVAATRWKGWGEWVLTLQLACTLPFNSEVMKLVKKKGRWNDVFNYWEIPMLSRHEKEAMPEIWQWIVDAFLEIPWSHHTIELHWNYNVGDRNYRILKRKIEYINNFWETGEIDYPDIHLSLVCRSISKEALEKVAISHMRYLVNTLGGRITSWVPHSQSTLNRAAINYLRHRKSSYHLLLERLPQEDEKAKETAYLKVFLQINSAIAFEYPWLKQECDRQIQIKTSWFQEKYA